MKSIVSKGIEEVRIHGASLVLGTGNKLKYFDKIKVFQQAESFLHLWARSVDTKRTNTSLN